ncbi:Catenin-beta-like protein [Boeremia exigua]|uniref:Catenin-beta-like protein n=1 Tax=Boeremia exigua TaxID=749465 RepID=UPI001E8CB6C3|nr:Catenin-beta-like protein [Boeremia exigua]KAH6643127.1 Catenin-beta-like protein [Boeremia exigua]
MSSIDDLFKSHSGAKRKFENPIEADPSQAYKSAKLQGDGDVKRSAQVEDEDEDDEAGPALPPDFEDEEPGDDEDGRFFGGGLDENAKDAMDFLDAQDGEDVIREEKYDAAWVRKLARDFEKKVNKNASLRAKYESDPSKFMESEGDLDDGIKDMSILSEHAELYEEFANSTAAAKLVELLAHENTDIAIAAIEIISELTDEDVTAEQEQWDALVAAFLEADLLSLLISNFSRFDENDSTDASGVYHSLSVLENLLSQPSNTDMIGREKALVAWLLGRIQKPEKPTTQNKQYASEILSILTQSSRPNRTLIAEANGAEIFLTNLAPYRRDDPEKDSDEEEYMENLFNCLTSVVEEPIGKTQFLEAEGTELCLLLVRDGKTSKSRALKVLDYACAYAEAPTSNGASADDASPPAHVGVCERFVDARGLKPLFSTFMKTKRPDPSQTEHILGIFSSLLRSLPGNSDSRFRLLAKFLENDFAKINKLITLRREYVTRLSTFDKSLEGRKKGLTAEERDELEAENTPLRLSEGLYALQRIDATLGWLVAEDEGAKKAIIQGLAETDETLADVKRTLQAQLDGVLEVEAAEREVLEALVGFLD